MAQRIDRCMLGLGLLATLGGCSLAPAYRTPALPPMPASFKEAGVAWQVAAPSDAVPPGPWWSVYGDPTLSTLEARLAANNPSLAAALAHYDSERAYASQLNAGLFPQLGISANPQRARQSDQRPLRGANEPDDYDNDNVGLQANVDLDLWGRVRNEVSQGRALAQAAHADLAATTLSLEVQLADDYVLLRGDDVQTDILNDSLHAYRRALNLTENRHAGGIASGLDVARAQAQLHDAQAQVIEVQEHRALIEHAIAALVGEPASSFAVAPRQAPLQLPVTPPGLPSALLQRRPDIAAAERRVYAANAGIGVARAAFFPDLSLSASYGWQSTGLGSLLSVGNRFWSLGPLATLDIFDAGLRRAEVAQARAEFAAASADYRQTVLTAIRQVEDNLVVLRDLGLETQQEDQAVVAARKTQAIATNRYTEGIVNYLEVVTAQTAALVAERHAEAIRTRRLQASVDLIRALGGDWSADALHARASSAATND